MLRPLLFPRVEQSNDQASYRVQGSGLDPLVTITQATSKPKVFFVVGATKSLRYNVLDFQHPQNVLLLTSAVPAPVLGLVAHARADI